MTRQSGKTAGNFNCVANMITIRSCSSSSASNFSTPPPHLHVSVPVKLPINDLPSSIALDKPLSICAPFRYGPNIEIARDLQRRLDSIEPNSAPSVFTWQPLSRMQYLIYLYNICNVFISNTNSDSGVPDKLTSHMANVKHR